MTLFFTCRYEFKGVFVRKKNILFLMFDCSKFLHNTLFIEKQVSQKLKKRNFP